jgi:hypothetical protein
MCEYIAYIYMCYYNVTLLGLPCSYVLCVCFYVCEGVPVVVVLSNVAVLSELLAICAVVYMYVCSVNSHVEYGGLMVLFGLVVGGFFSRVCVYFYYNVKYGVMLHRPMINQPITTIIMTTLKSYF